MSNYWNERFSEKEYAYGESPNIFFAAELKKCKPGTIIIPCDGEGRNSVFAASLGWTVHAFDLSEAGKKKALELAKKKKVTIHFEIADAAARDYETNSADAVAFIYAHFPSLLRKQIHQKAVTWLKPGGRIILEAFHPAQLNNHSGGPKDVSMLYSEEMIRQDFNELNTEMLQAIETTLDEGKYHQGKADVLRFVGVKK